MLIIVLFVVGAVLLIVGIARWNKLMALVGSISIGASLLIWIIIIKSCVID